MPASVDTEIAWSNRAIAVSSSSVVVSGRPYEILPSAANWLTGTPEHHVSAKKMYVNPAGLRTSGYPGSPGAKAA